MSSVAARISWFFFAIVASSFLASMTVAFFLFGAVVFRNGDDFFEFARNGVVGGLVGFVLTVGPVISVSSEPKRRNAGLWVSLIWATMSFFYFLLEYARYLAT